MQQGVPSPFDAFYRASNARTVRLAWLLVGSRAVAEDLVHDAYLAVFQRWTTIDNPGGYLRKCVVNLCLSWQRRQSRERDVLAKVGEPPPSGDPAVDTMWDAIQRLPHDRRAVVVLRYWADLPHDEIAELLSCPTGTVRSRLHKALIELREEVER